MRPMAEESDCYNAFFWHESLAKNISPIGNVHAAPPRADPASHTARAARPC